VGPHLDRTWGPTAITQFPVCSCGLQSVGIDPGEIDIIVNGLENLGVYGADSCGNGDILLTNDFTSWGSNNAAVANQTKGKVVGVGPGSTDGYADGIVCYDGCACHTYDLTEPVTVVELSCTPSVTRGATATCTVAPSGVAVSGWQFKDASGNTVNSGSTSQTWSGVMVTSGTVSVTASASGASTPLAANITVNPRTWRTSPASPVSEPNGTFYTLPVPPQSAGNDAGLGESYENTGNSSGSSTFISDKGPNNGYGYYATQVAITTTYEYEINPDLQNKSSSFYQYQCGNYNAQTNPGGYISGSNLLTQTNRHEWNSATESHYAFYSKSISGSNNPGSYVEQRVAPPGTNQQTFDNDTLSGLNALYQSIFNAFSVEPYPVNDDANGNFLGTINYAPYHSCS
jgi:hypothetical protein